MSQHAPRTGRLTGRPGRDEDPMRLPRKAFRAVALAAVMAYAVLLGAVPAGASPGGGWVRLAHLSPNAPAVDVYLYSFGNPAPGSCCTTSATARSRRTSRSRPGDYTVSMRAAGAASTPAAAVHRFPGERRPGLHRGRHGARGWAAAAGHEEHGHRAGRARPGPGHPGVAAPARGQHDARRAPARARTGLRRHDALPRGARRPHGRARGRGHRGRVPGHVAAADTIHTLVVLDGAGHLRLTDLEDAAGSAIRPAGGAATGLGGIAPRPATSPVPWLAVIAAGLLLAGAAARRYRRIRTP